MGSKTFQDPLQAFQDLQQAECLERFTLTERVFLPGCRRNHTQHKETVGNPHCYAASKDTQVTSHAREVLVFNPPWQRNLKRKQSTRDSTVPCKTTPLCTWGPQPLTGVKSRQGPQFFGLHFAAYENDPFCDVKVRSRQRTPCCT